MVSVTCRVPRETVISDSRRTCHCGDWDQADVVCRGKLETYYLFNISVDVLQQLTVFTALFQVPLHELTDDLLLI